MAQAPVIGRALVGQADQVARAVKETICRHARRCFLRRELSRINARSTRTWPIRHPLRLAPSFPARSALTTPATAPATLHHPPPHFSVLKSVPVGSIPNNPRALAAATPDRQHPMPRRAEKAQLADNRGSPRRDPSRSGGMTRNAQHTGSTRKAATPTTWSRFGLPVQVRIATSRGSRHSTRPTESANGCGATSITHRMSGLSSMATMIWCASAYWKPCAAVTASKRRYWPMAACRKVHRRLHHRPPPDRAVVAV